MSPEVLQRLFDVNHQALQLNVEGLSHEDSLLQPHPGGNCLNWVAGHIVATRNDVLRLLGQEPIWSAEDAAHYKRGSKPIQSAAGARPFESILTDFARSQERVRAGIGNLSSESMAEKRGDSTLGMALHFLQFHEAYHIGQAALLRRMAGKEGAIP